MVWDGVLWVYINFLPFCGLLALMIVVHVVSVFFLLMLGAGSCANGVLVKNS